MSSDFTKLWENVLAQLEKEVSRPNFLTLLKNTQLLSLEGEVATIAAPSITIIDMLQKRFSPQIKAALKRHAGKDIEIVFLPKNVSKRAEAASEGPLFTAPEKPAPTTIGHLPRVRPDFTFKNFAVSGSNQLAFVSANTVATNIGRSYNPYFIYGPVGVGKTHLMHAIANEVYQNAPEKKIIYITSEEFTNDVVDAIRTNDTAKMKKRFRSAYLLLMDDIQFIEGKERVQEELFHTFNILIDNGSQICLSSDRPPHEIKKLEKRLSSRFAGGLTVDIGKPDFELKTAILMIKAKKFGYDLPIEVAKILADKAEDTRSLEGILLRVITQATAAQSDITVEIAQLAMGGIYEERKVHVHADDIIKIVCEYYHVKPTQIKGPKRDAALVKARQIVMYLLKDKLKLTLVEIGNILGGRDHTTVMYGVDKIEHQLSSNGNISEDIMGITKQFRG